MYDSYCQYNFFRIPTESDIANALKELGKNVVEKNNTSHIKRLLKITMNVRRQWIEKESSRIAEIILKYPSLKHYEMASQFYTYNNSTKHFFLCTVRLLFIKQARIFAKQKYI